MSHWLPSSEPKSPFNINISSHQNVTIWKTRGRKKQIVFGLKGERLDSSPPPPSLQHISITTRVNLLVVDYSLNKCNGLILLLTLRLKVHIHTAIVRLWCQKTPKNSGILFFLLSHSCKISTENRAGKVGSCRTLWKYSLNWIDWFGLISTRRCEQTRPKVQLDKDWQWKQLLMLNHTLLLSKVFPFSVSQCFMTGQGI